MTGMSLKSPISGTFTSCTPPPEAGAAAGAAASAGAAAAPSVSIIVMTEPCETLSLCLTFTSLMVPATSAGTSIVALSVSSVMTPCSFSMVSPALIWTSMISTSEKSPMSGTFSSTRLMLSPRRRANGTGRVRSHRRSGSRAFRLRKKRAPRSNDQRMTRRKSPRIADRYALKRAASAPSMTRWSYDSDSGSVRRGTNCLPSHTGF